MWCSITVIGEIGVSSSPLGAGEEGSLNNISRKTESCLLSSIESTALLIFLKDLSFMPKSNDIFYLSNKLIIEKHQGILGSWPRNLILRDSVSTN